MTIPLVKIIAGNRAGQSGELSDLAAPAGQVYVRLAPHEVSRIPLAAKLAMQRGMYGAVTLQPWDNVEAA